MLAQVLLLVSLVEALDISFCSPDNTGSSYQRGKGLSYAHTESHINGCCSAELLPVQRGLSRHVQQQIRFCRYSRPKLLVFKLCSGVQRQHLELQRSLPWVSR